MKKFISLAIALAMILSVCPVLNAFAEEETVGAVRAMFFNNQSELSEAQTGDEGQGISLLIATGGSDGWATATSFTDLDGTVTQQASGLAGTGFSTPRNAVVAFELPDIDYDKLVNAEFSFTVRRVKQVTSGQRIGVYGNSVQGSWTVDAAGKAALGAGSDSGLGSLEMLGFTDALTYGNQTGATNQDQTLTLSSQKLVQYLKELKAQGYTEVTFRLANSLGGIWIYNAAQAQKPTLTLETGDAVEVTIKTVLADGTPIAEDKTVTAIAGEKYTYSNPTRVIEVDGEYYTINEEKSVLEITPTAEGENVIKLVYDKFDGTGLTGSIIADGATCWFADPRSLTVKGDGVNYTYVGYIDNIGNVRATQYDNLTGDYEEVLVRSNLQPDDHNNPSFLELPDHRILIIYSRHTDEACFYYRVSKEPYDITTFGEEKRLATANNTTYPNPFILSDDLDHVYMGWRGIGWHPTLAQMTMPTAENDYTLTFTWGPKQVVQSTGARPYAKYTSNGKDEIWVTYTTGHPDNENPNWLYFNRININTHDIMDVDGNVLGNIDNGTLAVAKNDASKAFAVDAPASGTLDWVWEVVNDNGKPVIAMVKISSDKQHHDYYYATYTGSKWQLTDLPDPSFNTFFHETPSTENCYSGGMSIDKANPHDVYASIPVDGVFGRVFEIVKWTLNDDYTAVVNEEFITENSEKDNARPYVANGSVDGDLRLTWFNGDYYYWIHSGQHGGLGYPVQMMTITDLKEMPVNNDLGEVTDKVYIVDGDTETVPVTAGKEFTISMNILQNDMAVGGTLLKSGNLQIDLENQTVDNTHTYAAVAPKLTVDGKVEKSQNLLSDSAWYFGLDGTGGTKSQSNLGWFNYTVTYDGSELVTYVNGLIDATMQNVDVALDDEIEIGGISGVITNVRSASVALTQAEVRAAAEDFNSDDVVIPDVDVSVQFTYGGEKIADGETVTLSAGTIYTFTPDVLYTFDGQAYLTDLERSTLSVKAKQDEENIIEVVLVKATLSENKLTNGDFTDGTTDWTDAATGAQYGGTVSSNYVHGDGQSLTNTASAGGSAASTVRRFVPVEAGKTYYLSYYAYNTGAVLGTGNNGAMSAFVPVSGKVFGSFNGITFKDYVEYGGQNSWSGESQSEVYRSREDMPYDSGMNHKEFLITIPEGAESIMISMFAWTDPGRLYFSDFELYEVESEIITVTVPVKYVNADGDEILPAKSFTARVGETYDATDYVVNVPIYGNKKIRTYDAAATGDLTGTVAEDTVITIVYSEEEYDGIILDLSFDDEETGFSGGLGKVNSNGENVLVGGVKGKALSLDGTGSNWLNAVMAEDGGSLLANLEEITISYYSKVDNTDTNWPFFAASGAGAQTYQNEYYLGAIEKSNEITIERYSNSDGRDTGNNVTAAISADGWRLVTVVVSKDKTEIYIDGVKVSEQTAKNTLADVLGSSPVFQIGKANWGDGEYYNGLIDEFKIYDWALSAEEIAEITKPSVSAEAALRIVDNEDGTAALGLAYTATVSGNYAKIEGVGFEYGTYEADTDGNYTVLPETLKDSGEIEGVPAGYRLNISGILNGNSARIYAVKPYIIVDGEKVYGEVVTATLYGALADSIINGAGKAIPEARLAVANSIISFVAQNKDKSAKSSERFPGFGEAYDKLYENGELAAKAKELGIKDDLTAETAMVELLSLESVEIEFVGTDVAVSETLGDITVDMDFIPEL